MKLYFYFICQELILMLLFASFMRKMNAEGTFLISPGGGREYTYSPVGQNASLECRVSNDDLLWEVDELRFGSHSTRLNERGIYQSANDIVASSQGLISILVVFGNITENNGSKVCCLSLVGRDVLLSCTTLILYGKTLIFDSEVVTWLPMML